jgi:hypothetical protein
MGFAFEIFSEPVVALPPLIIILITYGSNTTLPFRIPGALGALMLGGCLFGLQVCVAYAHVCVCLFYIYIDYISK